MAGRKCLKQDGQDFQDGQDKEGVLLVTYPLACCWRCVSEAGWPGFSGWPG